jgi:hypothetical protein
VSSHLDLISMQAKRDSLSPGRDSVARPGSNGAPLDEEEQVRRFSRLSD